MVQQQVQLRKKPPNRYSIEATNRRITADAVVIGATGDGPGENGNGVGQRVREGQNRHANADSRGGAAVQPQNDVTGVVGNRHLLLEIPDFAVPVALHWW